MKYRAHVCFNDQNWLIQSVFSSHITQKSAENMDHAAVWAVADLRQNPILI